MYGLTGVDVADGCIGCWLVTTGAEFGGDVTGTPKNTNNKHGHTQDIIMSSILPISISSCCIALNVFSISHYKRQKVKTTVAFKQANCIATLFYLAISASIFFTSKPNRAYCYKISLQSAPIQADTRQDSMTSRYKPSYTHGITAIP